MRSAYLIINQTSYHGFNIGQTVIGDHNGEYFTGWFMGKVVKRGIKNNDLIKLPTKMERAYSEQKYLKQNDPVPF